MKNKVSIQDVKKAVEHVFKFEDISIRKRSRELVTARQLYVKISKENTDENPDNILKLVNRDRSLYLHCISSANFLVNTYRYERKKYYEILSELEIRDEETKKQELKAVSVDFEKALRNCPVEFEEVAA